MRSNAKYAGIILLALSLFLFTSCAKKKVDEPSPLGPVGFAVSLRVSASPNVLFAGTQSRETTTVTAVLTKYDGTPLAGKTIFFELRNALNTRADGIGYFDGVGAATSRVTDGSGRITIDYHGPMAGEIPIGFQDTNFFITANVAWEGAEGISEWAPLYFVQDFQDLIFNVSVDPNVLWCANTRPESKITAFFAVPDGTPIAGRKVFFKIKKGKGQFPGGVTSTYKVTGADGSATMTYQGPTGGEMTAAEEFVTIEVQPETWWAEFGDYPPGTPDPTKYYIHVEFDIRLKKGN